MWEDDATNSDVIGALVRVLRVRTDELAELLKPGRLELTDSELARVHAAEIAIGALIEVQWVAMGAPVTRSHSIHAA